jgi:hypothetical protein
MEITELNGQPGPRLGVPAWRVEPTQALAAVPSDKG